MAIYETLRTKLRDRSLGEIARLTVVNLGAGLVALTPGARRQRRAERAFDRRWGTDTATEVSVRGLGFTGAQLEQCHRYSASTEEMLRPAIERLGIDPADWHFVDYGAGKGRAMMIALQLGFGRVTGVELSAALCAVARDNLDRFRAQNADDAEVAVVEGDATAFRPQGPRLLAYFYNPFGAQIMVEVRHMLESVRNAGGEGLHVVYANPEYGQVFEAPGWRTVAAVTGVSVFTYRG
ncbi:class I SAM-dependent methyltransferase [Sphingomonas sp. VNH70]|uniref:class I SAM-dependent methyltransferase n=1 Tax=Sphingomonas silueang TaxID=3156617 RepID=UPI0032B4121E